MNKLNLKDNLEIAVNNATIENQILNDYLSDLEKAVFRFEHDTSQQNINILAYEASRLSERLLYLNNNTLDNLMGIARLIDEGIQVDEEDDTNAKENE